MSYCTNRYLSVMAMACLAAFWATSSAAQQTFGGYPCTIDCSGHEAGYNWAREHDIENPEDCAGNSQSFIEGCQAFAEGASREIEGSQPPDYNEHVPQPYNDPGEENSDSDSDNPG